MLCNKSASVTLTLMTVLLEVTEVHFHGKFQVSASYDLLKVKL